MQSDFRIPPQIKDLIKDYFFYLVKKSNQLPLGDDRSDIHLKDALKTQLFLRKLIFHPDIDMELVQLPIEFRLQFEKFCENKGFPVQLFDFVFDKLHHKILELSEEKQELELSKVDEFIHQLYTTLVELWEEFRKSEISWENYQCFWLHKRTLTIHHTHAHPRPFYLGDIKVKGKLVHVFMDSQSGQVFFMLSFKSFNEFQSLFMVGVKQITYSDEKYLIELMKNFFQNF
jgi:hypothetical protein